MLAYTQQLGTYILFIATATPEVLWFRKMAYTYLLFKTLRCVGNELVSVTFPDYQCNAAEACMAAWYYKGVCVTLYL